jgi:hypothetical protein
MTTLNKEFSIDENNNDIRLETIIDVIGLIVEMQKEANNNFHKTKNENCIDKANCYSDVVISIIKNLINKQHD